MGERIVVMSSAKMTRYDPTHEETGAAGKLLDLARPVIA
jgi:hypothetical protein